MKKIQKVVFAVLIASLAVSITVYLNAATTIGTGISTAGNITTTAGNLAVTAGTLTVGGNVSLGEGTAASISLTPSAAGNITIGGATQTGAIFLGTSTATNTINIGNGITAANKTQTINVGTAGAANSTTTIGIGNSATGTSTITIGSAAGSSSVALRMGAYGNGITIGSDVTGSAIHLGTSTTTNTINIGNAITAANSTQTIKIGAAGTDNSATTIDIGSGGDGTSTITIGNVSTNSTVGIKGTIELQPTSGLTDTRTALYMYSTMNGSSTDLKAVNFRMQSSGAGSMGTGNDNDYLGTLNADFLAGHTGNSLTYGIHGNNQSAGIGSDIVGLETGNVGVWGSAIGTTGTGQNAAIYGNAYGAIQNTGVIGITTIAKASGTNIGVIGYSQNTGATSKHIGGFFGLMSAVPTFASAALMADNGAYTSDIFVARDNGTAVFSILDGGTTTTTGRLAVGTSTAPYQEIISSSGTTTLFIDTTSATKGTCIGLRPAGNGASAAVMIYINSSWAIGTTTLANCT